MTRTVTPILYQTGATLVELIVSIVVISIGLAGILLVMDRNTRTSADPMIQHQTVAIAEAYLEEILLKDFCDPNNVAPCTPGPANPPGSANCIVCPAAEAGRASYDNVCDYNSLPAGPPSDQNNIPISGLSTYVVQTAVTTTDTLNTLTGANCEVLRVQVTVTPPAGNAIVLSGYRTNY